MFNGIEHCVCYTVFSKEIEIDASLFGFNSFLGERQEILLAISEFVESFATFITVLLRLNTRGVY